MTYTNHAKRCLRFVVHLLAWDDIRCSRVVGCSGCCHVCFAAPVHNVYLLSLSCSCCEMKNSLSLFLSVFLFILLCPIFPFNWARTHGYIRLNIRVDMCWNRGNCTNHCRAMMIFPGRLHPECGELCYTGTLILSWVWSTAIDYSPWIFRPCLTREWIEMVRLGGGDDNKDACCRFIWCLRGRRHLQPFELWIRRFTDSTDNNTGKLLGIQFNCWTA